MSYQDFLRSKLAAAKPAGFEPGAISDFLFPFQRDIVRWAIRRGRAAIFADCGLGKTALQLEWARQVVEYASGPVLILAPLAVAGQTQREGDKFGIPVTVCRSQADVGGGINITNYEMLHHFDSSAFVGVVLDESSILKAFMGKTKRSILDSFSSTPFKLACTATPAPNDHLELGNHSEFLGAMASNDMISRWFINDAMSAGNYRLKGHAAGDFWRWVSTWAIGLSKPSDIGHSDDGFCLPPLHIHPHVVGVDITQGAGANLFRVADMNATTMHREMRLTANDRAKEVARLVTMSPGPWVVWCNTNYEADAVKALIPDAVEVRGSDSLDAKERRLAAFAEGSIPVLVSKPSILGYGMNWQHVRRMAFVGLSYSYENFYQALRRSWRFGQTDPVHAHVVMAETEGQVLETIQRKQRAHEEMKREMTDAMKGTTFAAMTDRTRADVKEDVAEGKGWTLYLGDSCQVMGKIATESVGLSVFSPPFENLYIYSDSIADMGNAADSDEFFEHFKFLIPELCRITIPGRICAVHCKDLPRYKGRDGSAGLRDFPGAIIRAFEDCGWTFHSRVTIWKSPVIEMQRTKNSGLLYKNLRADSSGSRQGMADYLLAFRKWNETGVFSDPVTHTREDFPLDQWQSWASPVWMDIDQMDVLNYQLGKDSRDEKHICPLQLGVIERAVKLWSNPGDLILDPFAGIGSGGYVALKAGRRFIGCELKESYWKVAAANLRAATFDAGQPTLFDMAGSNA